MQDNFIWTDELVKEFAVKYVKDLSMQTFVKMVTLQEFKEEKTKPNRDWEIVSGCAVGGAIHEWLPDNKHGGESCFQQKCKIFSVRRLSDGEVFSVGEQVVIADKNPIIYKILSFQIERDGELMVEYYAGYRYNFDYIKKVTKPKLLFTTEDGVEIFDEEMFVCYVDKGFYARGVKAKNYCKEKGVVFYKEEAAENYIVCNKPCLSVNDVKRIAKEGTLSIKGDLGINIKLQELEELVKEKLSK